MALDTEAVPRAIVLPQGLSYTTLDKLASACYNRYTADRGKHSANEVSAFPWFHVEHGRTE